MNVDPVRLGLILLPDNWQGSRGGLDVLGETRDPSLPTTDGVFGDSNSNTQKLSDEWIMTRYY